MYIYIDTILMSVFWKDNHPYVPQDIAQLMN